MNLRITTYNLHGLNQGGVLLPTLCKTNDIILMQEHWLYPDELDKFNSIDDDFVSICSSAMAKNLDVGIRRGRPYGGVGILLRKSLLPLYKCIAKRERFIVVSIADIMFVNVYFPCISNLEEYEEAMECILADLHSVITDAHASKVVLGGDFNFEFNRGVGCCLFTRIASQLGLKVCDRFIVSHSSPDCTPFTYYQLGSGNSSFIDHFCVSELLEDYVTSSFIVDSGENMSDHLPLCLTLSLDMSSPGPSSKPPPTQKRLRWDKADIMSYYYGTFMSLSQISIDNDIQRCSIGCRCHVQDKVDCLYDGIVRALNFNSDRFVPRAKPGFYKPWWNSVLSDLKQASIAAHNLWKACNRPRTGDTFLQMRAAKTAYKNAIRAYKINDDSYFSNDLHELLMTKDMIGFWKTWNTKVTNRPKCPTVVNGESNSNMIAEKFANFFKKIADDGAHNVSSSLCDTSLTEVHDYISHAHKNDFSLLDVETVHTCLLKMSKDKAPGADGIVTEHLLNAHPIISVQLCVLFNIMLKHGTVPSLFSSGVIIPVLKDKNGNDADINNYRGITLSPCISKLFEMCLVERFAHLLVVSPLQFGFQRKLSCSHSLYTLRAAIDFYNSGGSTVNVALLDMSKAFDRVNHAVLFHKLMNLGVPPTVLSLLMTWYSRSTAFVKWGISTSYTFALLAGVRQGGVLSPLLFCVYVDGIIRKLESSKLGCWIGDCYVGCVMYADDLVLISSSICELQKMIAVCADEATKINMQFNASKCAICRFGPRNLIPCVQICIQGAPVNYVQKAKYLGVMLKSGKTFSVDLHFMKSKFYRSFNAVFHKVAKSKDELVTLHLVTSYCRPYLLYATECVGLSVTHMRSLRNTWQCAVSHVFNVSGNNVNFICAVTDSMPLDRRIVIRRIKFLEQIEKLHSQHTVLYKIYQQSGRKELHWLRCML